MQWYASDFLKALMRTAAAQLAPTSATHKIYV